MVKLLHIKGVNCWSNQFFNLLLELLQDVFSMCEKKPISNYKTKKIIKDLSLHYEKIDACKNDCVIYYKKNIRKHLNVQFMEFLDGSLKKRVLNELPTSFVENLALFSYHTKTLKVILLSKTVAPAYIKCHFENHVKD